MDFYTLSDKAIEEELGDRLRSWRLRKDMTQEQLAEATALSLGTIKSLESGRGKLSTLIAVLRELGVLHELDNFIAEPAISPLQLAKRKGRERQRASGTRGKKSNKESEW